MNDKVKTGGSAFPFSDILQGMTLRDYFAAKAMATVLRGTVLPTKEDRNEWLPQIAEVSYEMADAMLQARSKL